MPDWLHFVTSPWTTPATLLGAVVGLAWLCRVRGRRLAALAAAVALALTIWEAWQSNPPSGLLDLQIYTNAARGWIDGGSIYDYHDPVFNLSATYPPIGPLLFAVFTPFTDGRREILFTLLSTTALAGCAWFTSGLAGIQRDRRVDWSLWAYAAATVTIPVWLTLRQGQVNIVLWFLILADLALVRRSSRRAGALIGLATAIKLVPGLFIVWLATTRRWIAMSIAILATIALTALGWVLTPGDSRRYWTELLWESGRVGRLDDARNSSLLGALARSIPDGPTRTGLWIGLALAVLGVGLVRATRASRVGDLLASAAIVGCTASFVSPISWTHHLGFLLVALAAFVMSTTTTRGRVLCLIGYVVLLDPGGHGDLGWMSSVRAALLLGAVLFVPIRTDRSGVVGVGTDEGAQTETTPRSRSTKSRLPSSSLFRLIASPPMTSAPRSRRMSSSF